MTDNPTNEHPVSGRGTDSSVSSDAGSKDDIHQSDLPWTIIDANVPPRLAQAFNYWVVFSSNQTNVAGTQWEHEWEQSRDVLFGVLGDVAVDDFVELDSRLLNSDQLATIEQAIVHSIDRSGWQRLDVPGWIEQVYDKAADRGVLKSFIDWHFPALDDPLPYHHWIERYVDVEAKNTTGRMGLPLHWGVPHSLLDLRLLANDHRADFVEALRPIDCDVLLNTRGIGYLVGTALVDANPAERRDRDLLDNVQWLVAELLVAGRSHANFARVPWDQSIVAENLSAILDELSQIDESRQETIWSTALRIPAQISMSPLLDVMLTRACTTSVGECERGALETLVAVKSVNGNAASLISRLGVARWSEIATSAVTGRLSMPYQQAVEVYGENDVCESLVAQLRSWLCDDLGFDSPERPEFVAADVLAVSRLLNACRNDLQARDHVSHHGPSHELRQALSALQGFVDTHNAKVREFLGLDDVPTQTNSRGDLR